MTSTTHQSSDTDGKLPGPMSWRSTWWHR